MSLEKETATKAILALQENIRVWGRHVDGLTKSLALLKASERDELSRVAGPALKFNLFCQVYEHVKREFTSSTESEKRKMLEWCFTLLAFENFEFDYRENILRLTSLFECTQGYEDLVSEVWTSRSQIVSMNAKEYIKTVSGAPKFNISSMQMKS